MSPIVLTLVVWTVVSVPAALLVGALFSTLSRSEPATVVVLPDASPRSR
jgi:hypothetical protein